MTLRCSRAWAALPAWGTAPRASFWLALEQPGPWGAKALSESRLPTGFGAALERRCADAGGRAVLVRSVGGHADDGGAPRRVLLAGGPAEEPWLLAGAVDDPAALLALPLDRMATEPPNLPGFVPSAPVALVCTNAKRDACCALSGRPVAREAAELAPGQVWESSHLGGHRFAPTALVLPTMQLLARVTADGVVTSLAAAGRRELAVLGPDDRGRSPHAPAAQAAESWVRAEHGIPGLADLTSEVAGDRVVVTHRDGRAWRLHVATVPTGEELPESCGKAPKPASVLRVEPVA